MKVLPTPDAVYVFVVAISLASVPDVVRFVKPLMRLLFIATSAPSDIPALLKPMLVVFVKLTSFIA